MSEQSIGKTNRKDIIKFINENFDEIEIAKFLTERGMKLKLEDVNTCIKNIVLSYRLNSKKRELYEQIFENEDLDKFYSIKNGINIIDEIGWYDARNLYTMDELKQILISDKAWTMKKILNGFISNLPIMIEDIKNEVVDTLTKNANLVKSYQKIFGSEETNQFVKDNLSIIVNKENYSIMEQCKLDFKTILQQLNIINIDASETVGLEGLFKGIESLRNTDIKAIKILKDEINLENAIKNRDYGSVKLYVILQYYEEMHKKIEEERNKVISKANETKVQLNDIELDIFRKVVEKGGIIEGVSDVTSLYSLANKINCECKYINELESSVLFKSIENIKESYSQLAVSILKTPIPNMNIENDEGTHNIQKEINQQNNKEVVTTILNGEKFSLNIFPEIEEGDII